MPNIAITKCCNLKCPYCFADEMIHEDETNFITMEELDKILAFIEFTPGDRIGIIGGEPTIHPQFKEILIKIKNFAKNLGSHVVLFTNGLLLDKYIEELDGIGILINVNGPNDIGEEKFNKIVSNLDLLDNVNIIKKITLGINLYEGIKDFSYIFNLCERYNLNTFRCSITAPIVPVGKHEYYLKAKERFLAVLKEAEKRNILVHLDCNNVPKCYFSDEELELYETVTTGEKTICRPVIDITPDMKATACFGTYDPIDLKQFDNLQQVENYLYLTKMYPRALNNTDGKCKDCQQFKNLACQGGCLSFSHQNLKNKCY